MSEQTDRHQDLIKTDGIFPGKTESDLESLRPKIRRTDRLQLLGKLIPLLLWCVFIALAFFNATRSSDAHLVTLPSVEGVDEVNDGFFQHHLATSQVIQYSILVFASISTIVLVIHILKTRLQNNRLDGQIQEASKRLEQMKKV